MVVAPSSGALLETEMALNLSGKKHQWTRASAGPHRAGVGGPQAPTRVTSSTKTCCLGRPGLQRQPLLISVSGLLDRNKPEARATSSMGLLHRKLLAAMSSPLPPVGSLPSIC